MMMPIRVVFQAGKICLMLHKARIVTSTGVLVGLLLIYSYWPVSIYAGQFNGSVFGNNPKDIGLTAFYDFLIHRVLPCFWVLLIINGALFVFSILVSLFTQNENFSVSHIARWSILFQGLTMVLALSSLYFDPGSFWYWFFD